MRGWPPITEPDLLQRLALEDEEFFALMRSYWSAAGPRELEAAAFERALGYPWERPGASYILRGEEVELLGDVDPERRAEVVADFARDRHPLLSFGGNGAPSWLRPATVTASTATARMVPQTLTRPGRIDVAPSSAAVKAGKRYS